MSHSAARPALFAAIVIAMVSFDATQALSNTPPEAPLPETEKPKIEPVAEPIKIPAPPARSLLELVEQNDHLQPQNAGDECLASAVYFEARGESLAGQLAVAEVVLNRAKDRRFARTVCGVVRQPHQFSFVRNGHIPAARRSSKAWRRAVAIAHIAKRELWETPANQALYFHATYVSPSWRHKMHHQAQLGAHVFYR